MSALLKQMLLDLPAGIWPLDETSGTTAYDYSGNSFHGTYSGTVTPGGRSFLGSRAPDFVSSGHGTVTIPDQNAFSRQSVWTIECWAYRPSGQTYPSAFMGKGNTTDGTNEEWGFGFSNWGSTYGVNNLDLEFTNNAGAANERVWRWPDNTATAAGVQDAWAHFAVTWGAGSSTLLGYLNGQQSGSTFNEGGAAPTNKAGSLYIGQSYGGRFFNGGLAYCAIYNLTLSADRIKAHYQAGIRNGIMVG